MAYLDAISDDSDDDLEDDEDDDLPAPVVSIEEEEDDQYEDDDIELVWLVASHCPNDAPFLLSALLCAQEQGVA